MRFICLFCFFIIAAVNMRVLALEQNKISSLSVAKGFADSSNNKLGFYENKGQIKNLSDGTLNSDVKFYLQNKDLNVYLLGSGIAYQFNHFIYPEGYNSDIKGLKPDEMEKQLELQSKVKLETYRMDMQLKGANPNAHITTEGKSSDYINYYNHDVLDVHSYSKIIYQDVYPKIDWVIYTNSTGLKYDFVVHPGGDPSMIQLEFKDQEKIHLDELGNLILENRLGKITEQRPISFQNGKDIGTEFNLIDNTLSFKVKKYQKGEDLIIDPCLQWATYYGSTADDEGFCCVSDGSGNVYLCGVTSSTTNISSGGFQNSIGGNTDAYLVKFNSTGARLWATYYGGLGNESGYSCVIDNSGNVYLCGFTNSTTNISSGGFQNSIGGNTDAYLIKFNSTGTRLWATYYGSADDEAGFCCVSDGSGNVYLCGITSSTTNISSGGYQNSYGGGLWDAFLVKFNSSGSRTWATYFGGSLSDYALSCAIDLNGNIYLCGYTASTTNIASGGYQNSYGGGTNDAFLVKFSVTGSRTWSTYLGGTGDENCNCCVSDLNGNVYICGATNSTTNIASGGFQNSIGGGNDAFLVKFNSIGQRQWGSYYGGTGDDQFVSCSIDGLQNVFCAGFTSTFYGLAYGGYQNSLGGSYDFLFTKFNLNGSRIWSTYLGGGGTDYANSCFASGDGLCYVSGGINSSSNLPLNGFQGIYGGGGDAFLAKFNICVRNTVENISSCNMYLRNKKKYFNSGTYYDTLKNSFKQDTLIVRINLTIKKSTSNTIKKTACSNYFWNNKYIDSSGIYFDTLINSIGCDSILKLNLTIFSSASLVDISVCKQYYLGKNLIIKSGVYYDTLKSYLGCDSIVTLNLRILSKSQGNISRSSCLRYFWNNKFINISGVYCDTLVNAAGCDSIVTLNLTVYPEIRRTFNVNNCRYYNWNNKYLNSTGIYIDTFSSYRGCDSIVTINLQIKKYAYTYDTLYKANCNPIFWRNKTISNTNVYYDTGLQKLDNCDIVHVLFFTRLNYNITKQPISKFIYKDQLAQFSILSQNPSSKYQWQGNNKKGSNWFYLYNAGPYSGVSTNVLKVKDVSAFLDAYAYRCIVSDSNCTETSNVSSLNICPEIIQQPIDRYNGLNTHVYYDVKVDFENVNYQWQVNTGSGFVDLLNDNLYNGVKSNKLDVFIQDKAQKNNLFRCIITKNNCVDTTIEVKLHLLEKTNPNPCNSQSLSSVYPNPSNDFITLLVPYDLLGKEYKIIDGIGKEVMTGIITKEASKINIKDLSAAVYFLKIGNEGLECFRIIKLNE